MVLGSFLTLFRIALCFPLARLAAASSTEFAPSWQPRGADTLPQEERMIADFLRDVASIESIQTNSTILTPCHKISRDSSFTRSWTHEDWLQHSAPPILRYWRHLSSWRHSTTAAEVLPVVGVMGLWASLLSSAACFLPAFPDYLKKVSVRSGILGSFASPIALLLTLRTNRALERLLDARKTWGVMSSQVQSLSGYFCSYVAPTNLPLALLALRYLAILSWTLKGFLRREMDDEIIKTVLPPKEAAWLLAAPADRPTAVLSRLRKLCMTASVHSMNQGAHLQISDRVNALEQCVGICKRLVGSPIPPTFTRHTARLVCLYLALLPIGLLGVGMSPTGVVIATSLTTYILVGVDEIGYEIEYPFPLLPMQELSRIMHNNVMKQVKMMRDMPQ